MSRGVVLGSDEALVVTVTPTAWGLTKPFLAAAVLATAVVVASSRWHALHRVEPYGLLVLVGPFVLVLATRTWRWRSHKIHVTTQRVVSEGGVLRHFVFQVPLDEIMATTVDQRLHERMRRRGVVVLTTRHDPLTLGPVRHPAALARVIEQGRRDQLPSRVSYDTVFDPWSAPPERG